jgi:hypothetical protein
MTMRFEIAAGRDAVERGVLISTQSPLQLFDDGAEVVFHGSKIAHHGGRVADV